MGCKASGVGVGELPPLEPVFEDAIPQTQIIKAGASVLTPALAREMLAALQAQHNAIDQLLALLITADPTFRPTKSAVWPALVNANATIAKAEAACRA